MATVVDNAYLSIKGVWDSWGINQSGQIMNNAHWNAHGDVWLSEVIFQTNALRKSSDYYRDASPYLTRFDDKDAALPYVEFYADPQCYNYMRIAPSDAPTFDSDSKSYLDLDLSGGSHATTIYKFTTDPSGATNADMNILYHTYCFDWGDHHYNYVVNVTCTPEHISQSDFNTGSATIIRDYYVNLGVEKSKLASLDSYFSSIPDTNFKNSSGSLYSEYLRYHYGSRIDDYSCIRSTYTSQYGSGTIKYGTKDVFGVLYITMHPSTFHNNARVIDKDTTDHTISISITDNAGIKSITWTGKYDDTTISVYEDGTAIATGLTGSSYEIPAAKLFGNHTWYVREICPADNSDGSIYAKIESYEDQYVSTYVSPYYSGAFKGKYFLRTLVNYHSYITGTRNADGTLAGEHDYSKMYVNSNSITTSYTGLPTFAWTKDDATERSSGVYTLGYWKVKLKADVGSDKVGTCGLRPSSVKFYLTSSKGGNHTSTFSATASTTIISWESATAGYDVVWNTDDSISISCTYIYSDGTEKSTTVKYIPPILTNSGNGVYSRDSESSGKAVFSIAIIQSDLFYAQGSVISSSVKYNTVNDSTLRDASISDFSGGSLGYIYSDVSIPVDKINAPIGKSTDLSGINLYYYDAYSGKVIPDDTIYGSGNKKWDKIYFLKLTNPASVASDVSVVPNKIKITWDWTASTSTDKQNSDSYISGFKVYEGETLIGTVASDKRELVVSASQGSHTYKVKAYCESYSAIDSDFVTADNVVTSVLTTPANFSATKSATDSATLTWDAVDGATGYDVYEGTTLLGTVTDNTVTYSSLSVGDHVYSVIASFTDTSYNSVATDQVTITISVLSVPNGLALTRNGLDGIDATWTAVSGASGYTILFDGTEHSVTSASYSATSLDSGNHTAKVKATF